MALDLRAKTSLDSSGFSAGLRHMRTAAHEWGTAIQSWGAIAARVAETVGRAWQATAGRVVEYGQGLGNLSAKLGMTVEEIARLQHVAKMADTDVGSLVSAMTKFETELSKGTDEEDKARSALDALGLSFDAIRKMQPADQFNAIAKAMRGLDQGKRSDIGAALFGEDAAETLALMASGATVATRFSDSVADSVRKVADEWTQTYHNGVEFEALLIRMGMDYRSLIAERPEEAFIRIAEALARIPGAAERESLARRLFGPDAEQFYGQLAKGAAGIDELRAALGKVTIAPDVAKNAMRQLHTELARTDDRSKRLTAVLKELGLTQKDLQGKRPYDQFMILADALAKIEDPGKRLGLTKRLFGEGGVALLPLLARGAAAIREVEQEAEKLGLVMSEKAVKGAEAFEDATKRAAGAWQGLWNASVNLDPFTRIIQGVTSELVSLRESGALGEFVDQVGIAAADFLRIGDSSGNMVGFLRQATVALKELNANNTFGTLRDAVAGLAEVLASVVKSVQWLADHASAPALAGRAAEALGKGGRFQPDASGRFASDTGSLSLVRGFLEWFGGYRDPNGKASLKPQEDEQVRLQKEIAANTRRTVQLAW